MEKSLRKRIRHSVLLLAVMLLYVSAYAQSAHISGKVVDADGNKPLAGVTVKVKETSTAVATDINGDYRIASI